MLYPVFFFAYGMLTHPDFMDGFDGKAAKLKGYKFEMLRFANILKDETSQVDGVLWTIDDDQLLHLDMVEGVPTLYQREVADVECNGKMVKAYVYSMTDGTRDSLLGSTPSSYYKNLVVQGYISFSVPTTQLIL